MGSSSKRNKLSDIVINAVSQRQRRREEKSSRKARSREDKDCCLDVIAEAVEANRREPRVVSRGLDLCESMICNDIASVRTWVMGALGMQHAGYRASCV